MEVVQRISELPASSDGVPAARIEIVSITIRDTPPPAPVPFSTETVDELAQYQAVLETSTGAITIGFMPDKAPEHVRNFLRLAEAGVFDGMAFHRVVRGFAVQPDPSTRPPLLERQQKLVKTLADPNSTTTKHVAGIVSMARGDEPASASTSFSS